MKKITSLVAVLAAITLFLTIDVLAADHQKSEPTVMNQYKVGDITIENPWARATISSAKTGAVFLTIKNGGTMRDKLIAVRSHVSEKTGIHQSLMEDGIMQMRPVKALEVTPGSMTMLKPGSYHVMFMDLKEPLKNGGIFLLTLVFEKAGEVEVMVKVMRAGAMGSMEMKHSN